MENPREYLKESRMMNNWRDVLGLAKNLFSEGKIQGIKFVQITAEHGARHIYKFFEIEDGKSLEGLFKTIDLSTNIFGINFGLFIYDVQIRADEFKKVLVVDCAVCFY